MFDQSNYYTALKYYDYANKLALGKMKDESACLAIKDLQD